MEPIKKFLIKNRSIWGAGLLGALFFILIFGAKIINPSYIVPFMSGDPAQHYFGWKLFREADWQPLIGMMDTANYPHNASIIFTDSIPIAACFFKLFRSIEPNDFQYFGLWGLMCFILQGSLSAAILKKYLRSDLAVILSSVFFILTPAFIRRMFWHTAMASHWLILLAILFFVWHFEKLDSPVKTAIAWGVLGILCPMIHTYYLAICGMILLGFALEDLAVRRSILIFILPFISFIIPAGVSLFFLGAFQSGMNVDAPGLGYYSFNLNGFINGDYLALVLRDLPVYAYGQFEGFAYLGLGILLMLIISLVYIIFNIIDGKTGPADKNTLLKSKKFHACLIGAVSIFLAASNEISFGDRLLIKIELSDSGFIHKAWQTFRATGRLVWPAMYLLMFFAIITLVKGLCDNRMLGAILLGIFLIVQLSDLSVGLIFRHNEITEASMPDEILKDDLWDEIKGRYKHIVFHDKNSMDMEELYAFADYAADNGMTINDYYFARAYDLKINEAADLSAKNPDSGSIYIFLESEIDKLINYPLNWKYADGFYVGLPR